MYIVQCTYMYKMMDRFLTFTGGYLRGLGGERHIFLKSCVENEKSKLAPVKRFKTDRFSSYYFLVIIKIVIEVHCIKSYTEQCALYTKTSCCFTACIISHFLW